jgi:hypothetical protein
MKEELLVRVKAMISAMAKECMACPYKMSSRCGNCWLGTARAIERDMAEPPKKLTREEQKEKILGMLSLTDFTPVSNLADTEGVDYRTMQKIVKELAADDQVELRGSWIRGK